MKLKLKAMQIGSKLGRAPVLQAVLSVFLIAAVFLIAPPVGADPGDLPFNPCTNGTYQYSETPMMDGWLESFDGSNSQSFCLINSSVFYIARPTYFNGDYYFTVGTSTLYKIFDLREKANIRQVEVLITYYAPSIDGVCLPPSTKQGVYDMHGFVAYNSPQQILLSNNQFGFGEEVTFDDAYYFANDIMVCDEWTTMSIPATDFGNNWGSSFTGNSKTLGAIGVNLKNVYVGGVVVRGTEQEIRLW